MDPMAMPPLPPEEQEQEGPSLAEQLEELIEAVQPKYPSWLYKTDKKTGMRVVDPPPKPKASQFEDWVKADEARYSELLARFLDDIRLYRQMGFGRFADFNPDFDTLFVSAEPTTQINKVAAMIAGTPHNISYPWRTKQEREDAEALETWALWFIETWEKHHRDSGSSELKWDLAWSGLLYGREVVRVTCDLEDGDFPWQIDVIDPATCYPTWGRGKHGLIRMSRRYLDTLGAIIDQYDPAGRNGIVAKFAKHLNKGINELHFEREVEVNECWTRWHKYVSADGIVIQEPVAHEYGVVPFVYNLAPGEMGTISSPRRERGLTREEILLGYAAGGQKSRQFDLAEKGVSFLHSIRNAIAQREAVAGMHMTSLHQTLNPATITTNPYPTPPEPLDLGPGGNNERKPGQQTVPAVPNPKPLDTQPLMGMLNSEIAKAALPDVIFGQVDGSNVTGFASDTLMAAAKDRIQPYLSLTEKTLEDVLVLATYLFRNFGQNAEGLSDGVLVIPRRGFGNTDATSSAPPPNWAVPIMMQIMQATLQQTMPPPPPFNPMANSPGGLTNQPQGMPVGPGLGPMGAPMGGPAPMMPGMPGMPGMPPPISPDGMPSLPMTTGGRPAPADKPDVEISRDIIDRLTGRPKVRLYNIGLQNRTMMANYLSMLVREKLISRAVAMDNIPEVGNAVQEWGRIMAEDAQTNPAMLEKIYHPRMLWEQGDVDGFVTYWATVLLPQMAQSIAPAPGAAPPSGPPAAPPGGPMAPQSVQGDSNAMLGQGPGAMGAPVGRPGGGPPGMM